MPIDMPDETRREAERLIGDMRAIGMAAGQCSVEGLSDLASSMAAAEAERCFRWAESVERFLARVQALEAEHEKDVALLDVLQNSEFDRALAAEARVAELEREVARLKDANFPKTDLP